MFTHPGRCDPRRRNIRLVRGVRLRRACTCPDFITRRCPDFPVPDRPFAVLTASLWPLTKRYRRNCFYALRLTEPGRAPESNRLQFVTKFQLFPRSENKSGFTPLDARASQPLRTSETYFWPVIELPKGPARRGARKTALPCPRTMIGPLELLLRDNRRIVRRTRRCRGLGWRRKSRLQCPANFILRDLLKILSFEETGNPQPSGGRRSIQYRNFLMVARKSLTEIGLAT